MFPATAADDKNFHSGRLSRWDISDGSVLAKSSERKPVAAVLRFRHFSQSLRIAKRLQRKAPHQTHTTLLVRYSPLAPRPIDPTDGG